MKIYKLKDLIQIHNGMPYSNLKVGNIPLYGSGGLMSFVNDYLYDGEAILLPRKGTLSNILYTNGKIWTVDTMYYATTNETANSYYLYSYLSILSLEHLDSGSTLPSMTKFAYGNIEIELPHIDYQNKVAKFLKSIAAKIELNSQINQELEAMAKTLYEYWFVQFDFPNEQGKPYKSSGGKMIYNKELKREIPEGWEVKELSRCIELIIDHRGKTPKKLGGDWSVETDAIIALSAKIVKDGKLKNLDQANKVSRKLYNRWMPIKLQDGDILMTSEAPAGEFYFIYGFTEYCLSQRLFAMRANKNIVLPSYFYYELSKGHGYSQIQGSLSGSTVFGIRQDVLRTVKVVIPDLSLQKKFDSIVIPQLKQIKQLDYQNQKLAELRDWLLPMLMNGQVTVGDVEEDLNIAAEPIEKYGIK